MKSIFSIFITACLIVSSMQLFAQQQLNVGANAVVRVNRTVITRPEVDRYLRELNRLSSQTGKVFTETEVVETLIDNELLKEAVRAARIVLDDNAFQQQLTMLKYQYVSSMRRENPNFQFTEAAFREFVTRDSNRSYQQFEDEIKERVMVQQFIMKRAETRLTALRTKVYADAELRAFRQENIREFVMPESLELKHIFFMTVGADGSSLPDAEKQIVRRRAEDTLRRLRAGEAFDALCELNTDDSQSRDAINPRTNRLDRGYLGFIPLSGQGFASAKQLLGENTINQLKLCRVGAFSEVLESPSGYHIFLVVDKPQERIISFEEARAKITDLFRQQEQERIVQEEYEGAVRELRTRATITYF